MKYIKTIQQMVAILFITHGAQLWAAVGGDVSPQTTVNSQVLSCTGEGTICNYSLNAVNDLKEISLTTRIQKLGAITSPRTISIQLPRIGGQAAYSLMLTEAYSSDLLDMAITNQQMEILLMPVTPTIESIKAVSSIETFKASSVFTPSLEGNLDHFSEIKVYRRMADEDLWNERGSIMLAKSDTKMVIISFTLHANGDAVFFENGEQKKIPLGKAV